MDKNKICIGFIRIPKKTILIHESILNGKIKVLSSGLKFICGYIRSENIDSINKRFNEIVVYDNNSNKLCFNVSIIYKIAGGYNYHDKDFLNYYEFIETCVIEEKNTQMEEWLCLESTKPSLYKAILDKIDEKGLKRYWHENHPVLQYYNYEDEINNNPNILLDDIKSSLQEAFNEYNGKNIKLNNILCRNIYYKLKQKMIKKGINLIEFNIKNLDNNKSINNENNVDIKLNEDVLNDEINDFVLDYVPLNVERKKYNSIDEPFILDYAPLETSNKNVYKKSSDEKFIVDYAPLEVSNKKNSNIESDGVFIVDYVPLETNDKKIEKLVLNNFFDDNFVTDCSEIDEVFESNCSQDEFEYEDTYDYLYEELDHEDEKNYSKEKVLVLK